MLLKLINAKILVLLFTMNCIDGLFERDKWLHDLVNYIQYDLKVHQTIIITDKNTEKQYLTTNDIIIKLKSNLPSKIINYNNETSSKALDLVKAGIKHFRSTALLIAMQPLEFDISDLIKMFSHLSGENTKPLALAIVLSSEKLPSYERLLQGMWTANFLDFTVLEVLQQKKSNNQLLLDHSQIIISVHQYNPFNKIYTKRNYSSKMVIFPTKLRDLNGFKMKVSSFNLPPTLSVTRNNSGYPVAVYGPDAELAKSLSKAMNFKIIEIASDDAEGWGNYDPINNKTTGAIEKMIAKKVQFSTNLGDCVPEGEVIVEFTRVDNHFCYLPVVPIRKTKTLVQFSWQCFYLGLLITLLIVLPVLVSYILTFDQYFWLPLYVFQAALGFGIPREPNKLAERIVFIISLFAFFISSSAIYAVFADFTLTTEVEEEIKTLEDLRSTNLTLMAETGVADLFQKTAIDPIIQSMANTIQSVKNSKMCIDYLVKHWNVTCILKDIRAHTDVNEVNKENPLIKVAKPCLRLGVNCMILQKGSPFLPRIDEVLERLRQGGLIRKWYDFTFRKSRRNQQVEDLTKQIDILITLLVVLVSGYLISFVAFACELFLNYFLKKNV